MREILFRGKFEKDWVKGLIGYDEDTGEASCIEVLTNGFSQYLPCDPKTICQYTGLKDKNGKKIFEGDILRYWEWDLKEQDMVHEDSVVTWSESCWFLNDDTLLLTEGTLDDLEIVGNIFDNPELLKEGKR